MAYYEYETSPRKIEPEYRRKTSTKKKTTKKVSNNKTTKKNVKVKNKFPVKIIAFVFSVFLILITLIYAETKVDESFSKVQSLKAQVSKLQKENDQIEISIQNSLNLNNIEQAAKEMLGMQKLTNKQIVYINLSKEDYVLPTTETVVINENKNIFSKAVDFIKNIF